MARRKAWSDLSPAYRKRLERSGITESKHDSGWSLQTARGHGVHTPSMQRKLVEQLRRTRDIDRLIKREGKLGYFPPNEIMGWLEDLTIERVATVIAWQESRHKYFKQFYNSQSPRPSRDAISNYMQQFPTLQQWVDTHLGPDAWDSLFADWWQDVGDAVMWRYYQ